MILGGTQVAIGLKFTAAQSALIEKIEQAENLNNGP